MRTLLQVLTDQSTIIFIFFRRHAQPGGENSHARGEGTKSVVALHLNQDSILIGSWRNQIRIHLSLIANRGFWGRRDMPDLEFCIFGIVGRHLTRAHVYVRQRSASTFTKVSIYPAMTPACSGRNDEEPSAKDSISEFVQPLELLADYIARHGLN